MDIALVVPELLQGTGGIPRYVRELERGLGRMGAAAEIVPFRYVPGATKRSILRTVPINVNSPRSHTVTHLTQITGASMLLFRHPGPTVVTVHDLGALLCPEDQVLHNWFSRKLFDLSLAGMRRADRIITDSEFTKHCLVNALGYDPDRVDTVWLGVDTEVFRPIPNAKSILEARYGVRLHPRTQIVLYVGSDQPRKNLPTLARALARLVREGCDLHWIKVGAPLYIPGRADLCSVIDREGLRDRVTFVGSVPDCDLPLFYSAADVYVQASVWEGFGLPTLEAMACCTAVVASDIGAIREVVGDAGYIVNGREANSLADGVQRVLANHDLRSQLVTLGKERASLFSWRSTAVKSIASYQRSISG